MKNSIKCVIVITAICLVIAAALGVTNYFTKDIIQKGEYNRTQKALKELIPNGEEFEDVTELYKDTINDEKITAVYKETSGLGYVFKIETKGYSSGLVIMCAVSNEGKIIDTAAIADSETPTIGGKVIKKEENKPNEYINKYIGTTVDTVENVDTVAGATITSKAYRTAVKTALDAFAKIGAN